MKEPLGRIQVKLVDVSILAIGLETLAAVVLIRSTDSCLEKFQVVDLDSTSIFGSVVQNAYIKNVLMTIPNKAHKSHKLPYG